MIIAILGVLVLTTAVYTIFSHPHKKAYRPDFNTTYEGKFEDLKELVPKFYWDWCEEKYNKSVDDLITEGKKNYPDTISALEKILEII